MAGFGSAMALSVLSMVFALAWALVLPFPIIYVIERVRANRAERGPKGLGAATVGCLMATMGWQTFLAGVAFFVADLIEGFGEGASDTAGGLILGSLIASVVPALILRRALALGVGGVVRCAFGVNAAMNGLMSMGTTIALCVAWMNDEDKLGSLLATTMIYTLATIAASRPLVISSSEG